MDTNCPSVNLSDLFPELVLTHPSEGMAPPNAMGFKLLAGPEVTIVSSKSSGRPVRGGGVPVTLTTCMLP